MYFYKRVSKIIESFFLTTNIPIQAFKFSGDFISSSGYNQEFHKLFNDNHIIEDIKFKISENEKVFPVTVSYLNNIYFTAVPICTRNIYKGLFILGPYTSRENHRMNIVYKPKKILPYFISLISIIAEDNGCRCKHSKEHIIYSLHVRKAIDYIHAKYKEDITLSHVADYLEINKSYFASIFKKETNKTFTQFLNHIRIEKSKELLLENNSSVLDVALAVGFNSQNYFNITFKRLTNQSPLGFVNSFTD